MIRFPARWKGPVAAGVTAGVAVLAVSLITNYQYSPKRAEAPSRRTQPI